MRVFSSAMVLACLTALVACGGDDNGEPLLPAPNTVRIDIVDDAFVPAIVDINQGDTIIWTNKGTVHHTVTSGSNPTANGAGAFFDEELRPGESFARTFDDGADFDYFCRFHWDEGMLGEIDVH